MIRVNNVSFRYSERSEYALRNVNFCCDSDGIIVVAGASGIGKSTLISLLAGIYQKGDPTIGEFTGSVLIEDKPPVQFHRAQEMSWVPQNPVLFDHLTVKDNILLPLTLQESRYKKGAEIAADLIEEFDLRLWSSARPRELSGGMKTRATLIRALATDPKILFLDEPFVALDLENRWRIYKVVRQLRSQPGRTTILSTHNIPEAILLGDRLLTMSAGKDQTRVQVKAGQPKTNPITSLEVARKIAGPLEEEIFFLN